MTLRDAALRYASAGWPVFPLQPHNKIPLVKGWRDAATTDARQIREWWSEWPHANIGFATGVLVVVEIDGAEGMATRRAQEAEGLEWPMTLASMSGRAAGGAHFWLRPPAGVEVRNCAGVRGSRGIGRGIDVRGSGGLVVLPPSIHPSGRAYQWITREPIAVMPAWMADRLKPPPPLAPIVLPKDASRYSRRVLERECDEVERAPDGQLNHTLNRSAFKLGRVVAAGALSPEQVRSALLTSAVRAGHPERSAARTIASGLGAGARR